MQAKVAFLTYCQEHGLMRVVVDSLPDHDVKIFDRGQTLEIYENRIAAALGFAEEFTEGVSEQLKMLKITEVEFMTDSEMGLRNEAIDLLHKGKLTIRKLLEIQPSVIVNLG